MTLREFRALTAHLGGERELLCAGAEIAIVWCNESNYVVIDDGAPDLPADATVLYGDGAAVVDTKPHK